MDSAFESTIPQFDFHNDAYLEKQNKINQYFLERQKRANEATSSENNYQEIDRSTVESFLSQNSRYDTTNTQAFRIMEQEDNYCTIVVDNYYYGGGAHGSQWIEGYCVDLLTGQILSLSDLFGSAEDFRHFVANYFYTEYSSYSDLSDWSLENLYKFFEDGDGANWYIEKDNLFVEYGDYALGYYAAGHQLFSIPLDQCSSYWTDTFINTIHNLRALNKYTKRSVKVCA